MWIIRSTREDINKKATCGREQRQGSCRTVIVEGEEIWKTFDGRVHLMLHSLSQCCYWLSLRVIHLDNSVVRTIRSSISFLVIANIGEHSFWRRSEVDGKEASRACWLAICCLQNWTFERLLLVFRSQPVVFVMCYIIIYLFLSI